MVVSVPLLKLALDAAAQNAASSASRVATRSSQTSATPGKDAAPAVTQGEGSAPPPPPLAPQTPEERFNELLGGVEVLRIELREAVLRSEELTKEMEKLRKENADLSKRVVELGRRPDPVALELERQSMLEREEQLAAENKRRVELTKKLEVEQEKKRQAQELLSKAISDDMIVSVPGASPTVFTPLQVEAPGPTAPVDSSKAATGSKSAASTSAPTKKELVGQELLREKARQSLSGKVSVASEGCPAHCSGLY